MLWCMSAVPTEGSGRCLSLKSTSPIHRPFTPTTGGTAKPRARPHPRRRPGLRSTPACWRRAVPSCPPSRCRSSRARGGRAGKRAARAGGRAGGRGPFLGPGGAVGFAGSGDKTAASTAVSIVGSLDPERLDAALEGTGDGLAARFLYVWPGPAPYRSLRTLKPVREDEMVNALQRIARAVGTPEKPLVLALEDQAAAVFDTCLGRPHGETLRAEGLLAGWLGKRRGTIAPLAPLL